MIHKLIMRMKKWLLLFIVTIAGIIPSWCQDKRDLRQQADEAQKQVVAMYRQLGSVKDTLSYYGLLEQAFRESLRYDTLMSLANEGASEPYGKQVTKKLAPLRQRLIDAGMYFYGHHDNGRAQQLFELYLNTCGSPLFRKGHDSDAYQGVVSYYAALLAYGGKAFDKADRLADVALRDSNVAEDAAELKINCMKELMRTPLDSSRYEMALLELHDKAPHNPTYFHLLTEYLSQPGRRPELEHFALDELAKDSDNVAAWALLGETRMGGRQWTEAIEAFLHARDIDSTQVSVIFNLGLCYGELAKAAASTSRDSCKSWLGMASEALTVAARLDPEQHQVKWREPLEQVKTATDALNATDGKAAGRSTRQKSKRNRRR